MFFVITTPVMGAGHVICTSGLLLARICAMTFSGRP